MTCIVGLTHKGKVYIGVVYIGSNGFTKEVRREHKVFENGDFLIGCAGSIRMMNILSWRFNPPTYKTDDDLNRFMCVDFIDEMRECFIRSGHCKSGELWSFGDSEMLVGIRGRLFKIESDFQVAELEYSSCGSGSYHALGCLFNANRAKPVKSLIRALECAENFVTSVQRPFIVKVK